MATTVARLEAVLSAQTRDFDRAMGRSDTRMQRAGRTAGILGGVLAGGLALGIRAGFREFVAAEKVTAQTNAVLKSTGGIANVTVREVDVLATSMMKKTGIDDEQIKTGANMLLTFTRIHDEAGRGNDIWTQATKVTTDLSVAMGKDMQSSAILVGKALNDPIKGLTALTRVGVSFTEQQREQIKAMVDSGNTMGAQKIILGELRTEFGGSAEAAGKTFAGQVNVLKESFRNLMAVLVAQVFPHLLTLVQHMTSAATWLGNNEKQAKILTVALGGLAGALLAARAAQILLNLSVLANPYVAAAALLAAYVVVLVKFRDLSTEAKAAVVAFTTVFSPLGAAILLVRTRSDDFMDVLVAFKNRGGEMLEPLITAFRTLARWVQKVVDGIRWLINHIPDIPSLPSIPNPFGDATSPGQGPVGQGPMDVSPRLWDELSGARRFGLYLSSGYRPGAITASGNRSDHSYYPSRAIDVAGPASAMAGFFRWLIGQADVKQAFYDPLGSIFGGRLSSYREGGHSDHVHVATYKHGGIVPGFGPQLAVVHGGETITPRGGSETIIVQLGDTTLARLVRNAKGKFEQRNGPGSF